MLVYQRVFLMDVPFLVVKCSETGEPWRQRHGWSFFVVPDIVPEKTIIFSCTVWETMAKLPAKNVRIFHLPMTNSLMPRMISKKKRKIPLLMLPFCETKRPRLAVWKPSYCVWQLFTSYKYHHGTLYNRCIPLLRVGITECCLQSLQPVWIGFFLQIFAWKFSTPNFFKATPAKSSWFPNPPRRLPSNHEITIKQSIKPSIQPY